MIKYGGLADKSDESIELQHQTLRRLGDRFRSITSYQKKETCIRKELRRDKSPEIQKQVDKCIATKKRVKRDSKRALDFTERQHEERETKRVKREAFVDGE